MAATQNNTDSSVLVVSNQDSVIDALTEDNDSGFEIKAVPDMKGLASVSGESSVIVLDMNIEGNNVNAISDHVLKIKRANPTDVIFVVGEKEPLAQLLQSKVKSLIYRAFTTPINAKQVLLSIPSAVKSHDELVKRQIDGEDLLAEINDAVSTPTTPAQASKKSPLFYAACALPVLAIAGYFIFFSQPTEQVIIQNINQINPEDIAVPDDAIFAQEVDNPELANLNELASTAEAEGRLISPENDNALHFYDKALEIDPYDLTAYQGKTRIIKFIEESIPDYIANKEFNRAHESIQFISATDPLNASNETFAKSLKDAVNNRISEVQEGGDAVEIAALNELLDKMGGEFAKSKDVLEKLQKEKDMLARIDQAVVDSNLLPPGDDNALDLISDARRNNTVSSINLIERAVTVSTLLFQQGEQAVADEKLDQAEDVLAALKKLNVDKESITLLQKLLPQKARQTASVTPRSNDTSTASAPAPSKQAQIIPEKLIKQSAPKYPRSALQNEIEGWVEVQFTVTESGSVSDVTVLNQKPDKVFEKATIDAVKKWKFVPARNAESGLSVSSKASVRLSFKLPK